MSQKSGAGVIPWKARLPVVCLTRRKQKTGDVFTPPAWRYSVPSAPQTQQLVEPHSRTALILARSSSKPTAPNTTSSPTT